MQKVQSSKSTSITRFETRSLAQERRLCFEYHVSHLFLFCLITSFSTPNYHSKSVEFSSILKSSQILTNMWEFGSNTRPETILCVTPELVLTSLIAQGCSSAARFSLVRTLAQERRLYVDIMCHTWTWFDKHRQMHPCIYVEALGQKKCDPINNEQLRVNTSIWFLKRIFCR